MRPRLRHRRGRRVPLSWCTAAWSASAPQREKERRCVTSPAVRSQGSSARRRRSGRHGRSCSRENRIQRRTRQRRRMRTLKCRGCYAKKAKTPLAGGVFSQLGLSPERILAQRRVVCKLSPVHQVFPPNERVIATGHGGLGTQNPSEYRGPIWCSCCVDGMWLSAVFVRTFAFNLPERRHGSISDPHFSFETDTISPMRERPPVPKA